MAQLATRSSELPKLSRFSFATTTSAPTPRGMEGLFSSVLPSLASALAGGSDDERVEALGQLAQVVDTSFGDDAVQVGGYLREHGVLKSLVWLLEHSDAVAIQQTTLLILGNLASDAVDASSTLTKVRLKELGAFEALLPHLFSDVWLTLVYALGAVQNMCRGGRPSPRGSSACGASRRLRRGRGGGRRAPPTPTGGTAPRRRACSGGSRARRRCRGSRAAAARGEGAAWG